VRYSWVDVHRLFVEYAWIWAGNTSANSAYASELVWNRARPRSSTDALPSYHPWIAHVSQNESACTWNVHEVCVFWCAPSVIHAMGVHQMFMEYCTVFAHMSLRARYFSDLSVIVNDTCAVHAWFVSDFYPWHPKIVVNFLTHKHEQTQSVRDLWVIHAWPAVWLAL